MFFNNAIDIDLCARQSKNYDKPIVSLSASDSKETTIETYFKKATIEDSNLIGNQSKKENIVDLTQESSVKIKNDHVDKTDLQFSNAKNYMTHYHVDQMQAVRQILEYRFGFNDGIMKASYALV